jgi:hypothetical protein
LIRTHAWGTSNAASDRRELDESAEPLSSETGKGGPGDIDDAEQIGFYLGSEILRAHLLDRGTVGVAGIVDDDGKASELGYGKREGRFGGPGIGDVERRGPEPLAVLLLWLLDVFRPAGRGKHRVTAVQDSGDQFGAKAAR